MIGYVLAFLAMYASVFYLLVYISESGRVRTDPEARRKPSVTVIVPAYNEEKTVGKTIESLLGLDYPRGKLEIMVVNDGSSDRTSAVARHYNVTVVDKRNTGKANSLNAGIRKARGDLVAVLDADSYVSREALSRMVGYFDDPDVAAVTASMKVWEPRTFVEKLQRGEYLFNAFMKKVQSFIDAISVTPGPFSVYRKEVFMNIGLFDENTLTEDQELALRIQAADLRIENSINAYVYTAVPRGIRELFRQRRRWYLGYLQNIWKHRSLLSPRYGDFGLFVLPMAFVTLMLTIASVAWDYLPRSFDLFFSFGGAPASLAYLELSPLMLVFLAVFLVTALGVHYTLRNTNESGFVGSFLSLIVISYIMLVFWAAVLAEQLGNKIRGVRPTWKGE